MKPTPATDAFDLISALVYCIDNLAPGKLPQADRVRATEVMRGLMPLMKKEN